MIKLSKCIFHETDNREMSLFRVFFVIVFSMIILSDTVYSIQDVIAEINLLFENKEFIKGNKILRGELAAIRKLDQRGIENEKTRLKPALRLTEARFYENYVGDLNKAKNIYKLITQLELPSTQKELLLAREGIKRIDAFNIKYSSQLQFLWKFKPYEIKQYTQEQNQKAIDMLSDFVSNTENEQLLALAHYHLGPLFLIMSNKNHGWPTKLFVNPWNLDPLLVIICLLSIAKRLLTNSGFQILLPALFGPSQLFCWYLSHWFFIFRDLGNGLIAEWQFLSLQ